MENLKSLYDDFVNCPFSSIVIAMIMIGVITITICLLIEDENEK